MKTIKQFIFITLAALMTASPAFAAEQNQSWWQRIWNGIYNYAKQYPKMTAVLCAFGLTGATYCAATKLIKNAPVPELTDEQEKTISGELTDEIVRCMLARVESVPLEMPRMARLLSQEISEKTLPNFIVQETLPLFAVSCGTKITADAEKSFGKNYKTLIWEKSKKQIVALSIARFIWSVVNSPDLKSSSNEEYVKNTINNVLDSQYQGLFTFTIEK